MTCIIPFTRAVPFLTRAVSSPLLELYHLLTRAVSSPLLELYHLKEKKSLQKWHNVLIAQLCKQFCGNIAASSCFTSQRLYPSHVGGEKITLLPLTWPGYKVTEPLYFPLETTWQSLPLTPTREDDLSISTHLGTPLERKSWPERDVLLQKMHAIAGMGVTSFHS